MSDARDFRRRLDGLGLRTGAAARLLRVHRRTVERWKSGDRAIPDTALRVLDLYDALLCADARLHGVIHAGDNYPAKLERALACS